MEVTGIGVALLLAAIIGGNYVDQMGVAQTLTFPSKETLVICPIVYGFRRRSCPCGCC